jgi:nucleoside 2-deoxyribosyltransferase
MIGPNAPIGSVGLDSIDGILPRTASERFDRTLLNLSRMSHHLGDRIRLNSQNDQPLTFGKNEDEFHFVMGVLADESLIRLPNGWPGDVQIRSKGYSRIAELERGLSGPLSKQVFVAMAFDPELDVAYNHGIKPAIKDDCDYDPMRVDLKEHNEDINDVILAEMRKSKFIVADFTLHRHGVYFEAGFFMGMGRPVIFTCHKDHLKDAHFDTRQYNHIPWKDPADLREKLKRRIQATIPA